MFLIRVLERTIPGKVHLQGHPGFKPVIRPARKVPVSIREKFKEELQRLESLKVIAPVDEPTEWVSQIVVAVKKSGELRVCIDPKPLNDALKREHYQIPVIEDLLPDLTDARVFTKADLASAFWHLELDHESSMPHNLRHTIWAISLASFTLWSQRLK